MRSKERYKRLGIRADEVTVRLAQRSEYDRWDELMREHHDLGFERFAGRGLRYIVEQDGKWLALAGWQTGVLKCAARDKWIGWCSVQQYKRLHLIANNTRFALLATAGSYPNLASYALSAMCRRLSDDWQQAFGHGLLLAETFVDPERHSGHMYAVSGWQEVGMTKGYARKGGRYTAAHHKPKRMLLKPLRKDARDLLQSALPLEDQWQPKCRQTGLSIGELESLYASLEQMQDVRRAQGRKHRIACVYAIYILARLSGFYGPVAAAQFADALSQQELQALGAWRHPKTGRYVPVSKSTLHRVLQRTEPGELERVLARYSQPRVNHEPALAADGKRIRGANRNGEKHYETVTLISHDGGLPLATRSYQQEGGEIAATREVLDSVDVAGRVITLDALHSTLETAQVIVDHKADYMMTLKDNTCAQLRKLKALPWWSRKVRTFGEDWTKVHGRIEQRQIEVLTPPAGHFAFRHVKQAFRIERSRELVKDASSASTEVAYGITSVAEQHADAEQLLGWNRGHWCVENRNHYIRDTAFDEDACRARTGNAPANNALCNNIALALIFHHTEFETVPQAIRHFSLHREDAFGVLLAPT